MKFWRRLSVLVPAVMLVVSLVSIYVTREAMANLPFLKAQAGRANGSVVSGLVDQRPWQTIEALAPLALSSEEKRHAREAERLADHEVDQAFAQALRQASMETRNLTGAAKDLQEKVATLSGLVKDDQAKVDSLLAASKGVNQPGTDDLDIAKAQLQLDSDQLEDIKEDLARESGDKRGLIQQELTAREAAMKKYDERPEPTVQPAVESLKRYGTLSGRVNAWFDQRSRMALIAEARAKADADAIALTAEHEETEKKLVAASGIDAADTAMRGRVARLTQMHSLAQIHGLLDDRTQTQKQLSVVYGRWLDQVKLQHRIVTHLILVSVSWIALLLLLGALLRDGARKVIGQLKMDRRSLQTLRMVTGLGIQGIMLLLVLLVIFGAPSQTPTILGFATAALTVVFQDFILSFFGWFVLMGKSGIRLGDWVEINGVGGEVADVGLFRTSLLETGNWTAKGRPTGRWVRFMNKYAISGQYFNFSTTGQWMWDEIRVNVPGGSTGYKVVEAIQAAVLKETEQDVKQAEDEWKRATQQEGLSQFSATSSVDMRPAASGIDVIVRYVTRAGDRFEARNRLYQKVLDLLHKKDEEVLAKE